MDQGGKLFEAGRPIEIDVRLLDDAFGIPERGTMISYAEITRVTGESYGTARFENIVTRWREVVLHDYGIASRRQPGEGVLWLTEERRSGEDIKDIRSATRKQLKVTADLARVDRNQLRGSVLARHDHALVLAAKLQEVAVPVYKGLEPPPPLPSLPRPPAQ